MSDLIKREDAIEELADYMYEIALLKADGQLDTMEHYLNRAKAMLKRIPSADRPQGHWTKTDVATYRCSECGKIQIADDVNELNFCCCCGSRNKVRRLKGADDE